MTHEETVKIVRIMVASYPNFKPIDIKDTIETWEMMLSEYSYEEVALALKSVITTDTSGFAPSIGKIIDEIHKIADKALGDEMTGEEAWSIVMKAVSRGNYYAQEDYSKMPPLVQKALGSPAIIKEMASDPNFNMGVEQSHFLRAYNRAVEDEKYMQKLPTEVKALLGGTVNGNVKLGNTETVCRIEG